MDNLQEEDEQKIAVMRKAFQMFDTTKSGFIDTLKISTILNTMGQLFDDSELNAIIGENDPDNSGKVNFDVFCKIAGRFLEEEDAEAMQEELKEAFRLYDREGNGYITTATLKEILAALDDKLTSSDLDGIIAEIDTDGSGTVDFDGESYSNSTIRIILIFIYIITNNYKSNIFLIRRIHGNDDGRIIIKKKQRAIHTHQTHHTSAKAVQHVSRRALCG